ncbi:MAG: transposase zinc-binding domain-containing protein [Nitrosomonas sp.]|nr:transposase zinc-binding domain-containing protein [Nitrosomonas sp.]
MSHKIQLACERLSGTKLSALSRGYRHCPHCQADESQRWIDQQLQKLIPAITSW